MAGAGAREKRSTAARLKAALSGGGGEEGEAGAELRALLERVLRPGEASSSSEALAWCRCLLAGGEPWDGFVQAVRAYDPATLCGLVWTANFVAYRCRTCGISPCMSLCAECFHQGEHAGHDYNMFRSQAGGACDCGDGNVMREAGCQKPPAACSGITTSICTRSYAQSEPVVDLRCVYPVRIALMISAHQAHIR
uniref:E3 ubiquitin-protein ligase ubr3 n=1 Tax=Sphaerodactylus townsendi TaxID=933632 RepID=A0ACB8G161_9SAUR